MIIWWKKIVFIRSNFSSSEVLSKSTMSRVPRGLFCFLFVACDRGISDKTAGDNKTCKSLEIVLKYRLMVVKLIMGVGRAPCYFGCNMRRRHSKKRIYDVYSSPNFEHMAHTSRTYTSGTCCFDAHGRCRWWILMPSLVNVKCGSDWRTESMVRSQFVSSSIWILMYSHNL